jgi:hypothetical protein
LKEMLRVDHAGELGAVRIYDGQLAGLSFHPKSTSTKRQIRHMHQQEKEHLAEFNHTLPARRVRPTALQPFWHVAGGALGFATAALGENYSKPCRVKNHDRRRTNPTNRSGPCARTGGSPPVRCWVETRWLHDFPLGLNFLRQTDGRPATRLNYLPECAIKWYFFGTLSNGQILMFHLFGLEF